MADMQKLQKVRDWIGEHPEQHDQRKWARRTPCGSAMCFAGTAVHFAEYRLHWEEDGDEEYADYCEVPESHPMHGHPLWSQAANYHPELVTISKVAQIELALSLDQQMELFSEYNSLDGIDRIIKGIDNGEDMDAVRYEINEAR